MSSIIKVTARIKRESKLGIHLVNDSQLTGYPNELIRLAIQGLLYEQLLTKNSVLNLAFNESNPNVSVANTNHNFDTENQNTFDSTNEQGGSGANEQVTDNEIDLLSYLDKYIEDSNLNLEDLNYNNS